MATVTVEIPTRSDLSHYQFSVDLDRRTYQIVLRWNPRASAWFMSLLNADGEPLLCGLRATVSTPLLFRYQYNLDLPPGILAFVDTGSRDEDPGETDLGKRVILLYREASSG